MAIWFIQIESIMLWIGHQHIPSPTLMLCRMLEVKCWWQVIQLKQRKNHIFTTGNNKLKTGIYMNSMFLIFQISHQHQIQVWMMYVTYWYVTKHFLSPIFCRKHNLFMNITVTGISDFEKTIPIFLRRLGACLDCFFDKIMSFELQ